MALESIWIECEELEIGANFAAFKGKSRDCLTGGTGGSSCSYGDRLLFRCMGRRGKRESLLLLLLLLLLLPLLLFILFYSSCELLFLYVCDCHLGFLVGDDDVIFGRRRSCSRGGAGRYWWLPLFTIALKWNRMK